MMGADGAVPAPANLDPEGAVQLFSAAEREDVQEVRRLQRRMTVLRNTYGAYGMLPGLKFALHLRLGCSDALVAPTPTLGEQQKQEVRDRLQGLDFWKTIDG